MIICCPKIAAPKEFCEHYGMEPTRNNKGIGHENGGIESPHRHLKRRIEQALMLRDSSDFSYKGEYEDFVRNVISRSNGRHRKLYQEELKYLKPLPLHKAVDFTELSVPVSTLSTINLSFGFFSLIIQRDSDSDCDFFDELIATGY